MLFVFFIVDFQIPQGLDISFIENDDVDDALDDKYNKAGCESQDPDPFCRMVEIVDKPQCPDAVHHNVEPAPVCPGRRFLQQAHKGIGQNGRGYGSDYECHHSRKGFAPFEIDAVVGPRKYAKGYEIAHCN